MIVSKLVGVCPAIGGLPAQYPLHPLWLGKTLHGSLKLPQGSCVNW